MKIPYLEVAKGMYSPIVTLEIYSPPRWIEFEAYVDSGATFSIFHKNIADILDIDYKKGRLLKVIVGDGNTICVYIHKLLVRFNNRKFVAQIGFSSKLGVGFNLLGRRSFFDRFQFCFNDKKRLLTVTPLI